LKSVARAVLRYPPSAVSAMLGKKAARAAATLAFAATNCASAEATSGRRVSNSEGKPGLTGGSARSASVPLPRLRACGSLPIRMASASIVCRSCCLSGGIAACKVATVVACCAISSAVTVPTCCSRTSASSIVCARVRLSSATLRRSRNSRVWRYVVATLVMTASSTVARSYLLAAAAIRAASRMARFLPQKSTW